MKKISLLAGLLVFATYQSQIKFENGYVINNSGEKQEVLIKNSEWKNNPKEIEYRLSNTSEVKKENTNNIKEFGVGTYRFVREKVKIDRSSLKLTDISEKKEPEFHEETLLLRYLIDGKADLLSYEQDDIRRFFYRVDNSEIKQLVYKNYNIGNGNIAYNEEYKDQISADLKCGITGNEIDNAKYSKKDFVNIFSKFNECSAGSAGSDIKNTDYTAQTTKRDIFNVTIRPGVNSSSLSIGNDNLRVRNTDFDSELNFRIGVEFEYIFPFNKNKWSAFVEPTYQSYKSSKEVSFDGGFSSILTATRSVEYSSIEVPIGIRHYFFLNDQSKFFVDFAYVIDFSSKKSHIDLEYDNHLNISSGNNIALGVGYKYNDRFSAEFRYLSPRSFLDDYVYWQSEYKTISLVLGYTLF
ncbi:outer membrane beta-barrel protein [Chryseobacterium daecheongense]|uniref:Outer membrane protein with beta-barrel domain n=1 Tax=Chryseobacterium daecheongense TaxID=192389 RepID=A0ABY2FWX7_9FLAO|nr:outer membrane beta-barrel protein [Chryseobacterium daecheongense]TDX93010.1 outer membrane protein with beta-barrel domain [Chryseobacterium daecheongense]